MKKLLLLVSTLALLTVNINAQILDWAERTELSNPANSAVYQMRSVGDLKGNVYITGDLYGTVDMDASANTANITSPTANMSSGVVAKYNAVGLLLWAKNIGGKSHVHINGIALDDTGNVYMTGTFIDTADFDMDAGVYNMEINANYYAGFIAKYDSNGAFKWAEQINHASPSAITVDGAHNIYLTGTFAAGYNVDFDPGAGISTLTTIGISDVFVAKYDNVGNYRFAKQIGGANNTWSEVAAGIKVSKDKIYVAGMFNGLCDFNPPLQVDTITSVGNASPYDLFMVKYDTAGNFTFVKTISGLGSDAITGVATDTTGNLYVSGQLNGTDSADFDPSVNTYMLKGIMGTAGFFAKYTPAGTLVWANIISTATFIAGPLMALDAMGNIHLCAEFNGATDFDPSAGTSTLTGVGGDSYYTKYSPAGTLMFARQFKKDIFGDGASLAITGLSDVVVTGHSMDSVDCDLEAGVSNLYTTNYELMLAKYKPDCSNFSIAFDSLYNLQNPCPDAQLTLNGLFPMAVNVAWSFGESNITAATSSYPLTGVCPENYVVTVLDANGCLDTLHFNVPIPTGVEELSTQLVHIYPNPTKDNLYIQVGDMKNASVEIYTITGQLIQKTVLNNTLNTINIEQLSAGVYTLKLVNDTKAYYSKIIKN